ALRGGGEGWNRCAESPKALARVSLRGTEAGGRMSEDAGAAAAIDLAQVEKVYPGGVRALDAAAMRVMRGEIFGLLGANGAGKSTLVKILMTVVRPTRLEGTMLGAPVGRRETL